MVGVVWAYEKGKINTFGVSNSEEDIKYFALKAGKDVFKAYLSFRYELGQEKDQKKMIANTASLENALAKSQKNSKQTEKERKYGEAFRSIMLGIIGYGKNQSDEIYNMFEHVGIISDIVNVYSYMLEKGYEVEKDKNGNVTALSITGINTVDILKEIINGKNKDKYSQIEQYLNLNNIPATKFFNFMASFEGEDSYALAMMNYVITKDGKKDSKQIGMKSFATEEELNKQITTIKDYYNNYIDNTKKIMESALDKWSNDIVKKTRTNPDKIEEAEWAGVGIYKFSPAECNIGTSNYLRIIGYGEYNNSVGGYYENSNGVYEGVYWAISKYEKDANNSSVTGATGMIDSIEKDPDFTSLNSIINWDALKGKKAEEIKTILTSLFNFLSDTGFAVVGTMLNSNGSSHIFPVYNGQSLDINYQYGNGETFEWGRATSIWVSIGGEKRWGAIIENAANYGTFEFRDQWIEDETPKILNDLLKEHKEKNGKDAEGDELKKLEEQARKKAIESYRNKFCGGKSKDTDDDYLYNFYILNYPVIYLTNIYSQFFFTNIPLQ